MIGDKLVSKIDRVVGAIDQQVSALDTLLAGWELPSLETLAHRAASLLIRRTREISAFVGCLIR